MRPPGNLEGKVTTIQGPQHRAKPQGPPRRYPLPLQLHYKATSKLGPLYGFGQIRVISSKDIIFGPGDGLQPGANVEIVVAWPRLLDGRVRLQLVLETIITSSQDGVTEARILTYDFRTRPLAAAQQRAEPAAVTARYSP
jgi:hypothetical protein